MLKFALFSPIVDEHAPANTEPTFHLTQEGTVDEAAFEDHTAALNWLEGQLSISPGNVVLFEFPTVFAAYQLLSAPGEWTTLLSEAAEEFQRLARAYRLEIEEYENRHITPDN